MFKIDLNCDMGESFGSYHLGNDEKLLDFVTSANIACGFHAGDPTIMRKTVRMALDKKVAIGAHPGLPDLAGFGRRNMQITPQEAYDLVLYQIGALSAFVKAEGGKLQHVKPHGALYNMAAKDEQLSLSIAKAIYQMDPELILFGLSGSELIKAGRKIGLRCANEVFADRTYQQDGSLTPRANAYALINTNEEASHQVITMIKKSNVRSLQGTDVSINAETICIHGDGNHALEFAKHLVSSLQKENIMMTKAADVIDSD
ncbi:5-oxoprolinase subunit PxpA [Niallia sp. Krafla_26]|uniref:5-oxoprolinase subunit PxpA n=1 Tax=Niallia sp. Krafla_26 TaxID=3064703 RepID=UPI003D171317